MYATDAITNQALNASQIYISSSLHTTKRCFSSTNKADDDDFDFIPPLDLSTPSTSIPLPPNLLPPKKDDAKKVINARGSLDLNTSMSSVSSAQSIKLSDMLSTKQDTSTSVATTTNNNDDDITYLQRSADIQTTSNPFHATSSQVNNNLGLLSAPNVNNIAHHIPKIYHNVTEVIGGPSTPGGKMDRISSKNKKQRRTIDYINSNNNIGSVERLQRQQKQQLDMNINSDGVKLTSSQRDKLRNRMRGRLSSGGQERGKKLSTVLNGDVDTDNNTDYLMTIRQNYEEFVEMKKSKVLCSPPRITDKIRSENQIRLKNQIQELEKNVLHSDNAIGRDKLGNKLAGKMRDLFRLEEFGITPGQLNSLKTSADRLGLSSRSERDAYLRQQFELRRQKWIDEDVASSPSAYNVNVNAKAPSSTSATRQQQSRKVLKQSSHTHQHGSRGAEHGQESGELVFPTPHFDASVITTQANGTILGHSGSTTVLSTVVLAQQESGADTSSESSRDVQSKTMAQKLLLGAIQHANAKSGATFVPLQVDYRERYHSVGKIPMNMRRRDNTGPLSDREVLAARVVDRTIRPWLLTGLAQADTPSSVDGSLLFPDNIVVNCEVQAYDPSPVAANDGSSTVTSSTRTHADPTALAINSTIAALYQAAYTDTTNSNLPIPSEAAACVKLAILRDGTVIYDPTPRELDECKLELLYAGTRDKVLMLEFSSNGGLPNSNEDPGVDEGTAADAIRLAHEAIIPIIDRLEQLREKYVKDLEAKAMAKDETLMTDEEVAQLLGLDLFSNSEAMNGFVDTNSTAMATKVLDEANAFVWEKVKHVALKLFGYDGGDQSHSVVQDGTARIHNGGALLSKKVRGRRENILQSETARLLRDEFTPSSYDENLATLYHEAMASSECVSALSNHIHENVMKQAMAEASSLNFRSDGRLGLNVVRPISVMAPILPDAIHGSALFRRGETQVMCTATVGAPKEGLPLTGPYVFADEGNGKSGEKGDDEKVPVGSLRFLRNQAEIESDMNSRKIVAGREMTGDSGILSEVCCWMFLLLSS